MTVVRLHALPLDERMWERPCSPAPGRTPTRRSGARSGPRRSRSRASAARGDLGGHARLLFTDDTGPGLLTRAEAMALIRTVDELVAALEAIRDRPDSIDAYRALGARKLTIVGDRDSFVSVEDARGFDPGAVVLPGCGHLPSLERPVEFDEVVREAIERWT